MSWLDFKLGYRMLIKHPGMTVTAGLAIAFSVMLGAATFEFATDVLYPTLPVDEPDRLVEIRNRDATTLGYNYRALHDFATWRQELRSVSEVGAFETFRRTLRTDEGRENGQAQVLMGADMTAAAFQIARVPPLMGRGLLQSDEASGAPNVLVIGYDVWRSLFGGDPDVVGQPALLGAEPVTVVGVMPEGFRFPRTQDLWRPLRHTVLDFARSEGPDIQVLARLAPGSSLRAAQTELTGVGQRTAAEFPDTHERLRPEVVRYGRLPVPTAAEVSAYWSNILVFMMLLSLSFGNVALLLFTRTAAREREIVLRSALGATRARIVTQLVAEALILAAGGVVVGLVAAEMSLGVLVELLRELLYGGIMGYWVGDSLSPLTTIYTFALAVTAAVACGVVPALKVTGRGVQSSLKQLGAGGSSPGLGRLWSGVIATQIAATVAFVPPVIVMGFSNIEVRNVDFGFSAAEYMTTLVDTDRAPIPGLTPAQSWAEHSARYSASIDTLKQRLESGPGVAAVVLASRIPGADHRRRRIEVDGPTAPVRSARSASGHRAETVAVDMDFFAALGAPIVSGRKFYPSDLESGQDVVIVNEDFVRVVLGGRNPIGLRLRYGSRGRPLDRAPDRYHEIVGVVKQIAMTFDPGRPSSQGVYHLLRPNEVSSQYMVIKVGQDPASFARQLQMLAAEVAPTLQLRNLRPLDEAAWDKELSYTAMFWLMLMAGGLGVLLSTSGIYAIMSFTVSRRTREVGVRVALGATQFRVASTILSRSIWQIVLGVVAGGVMSLTIMGALLDGTYRPTLSVAYSGLFLGYLTIMLCVCLLACIVPTRRALQIQPMQALKADA